MRFMTMLFPNRCFYCNTVIEPEKPVCDKCASRFILKPFVQVLPNGFLCVSAYSHNGKSRKQILEYKFKEKKYYYKNYAAIINIMLHNVWPDVHFDYLTSVPTFKTKMKTRGYDQAKLIAVSAADLHRCKYRKLLIQYKSNKSQKKLNAKERRENVKDVFKVSEKFDVTGKTILIIDDVVTTGATLSACADVLLDNGAVAVYCATVTYAVRRKLKRYKKYKRKKFMPQTS